MIAKCVALLAVVAQINGYVCNSNCASGVVGSGLVGSAGVVRSGLLGSGLVGSTGVVGSGLVGSTGVVGSGLVGSTGVVGSGLVGSTGVVGSGLVGSAAVVGSGALAGASVSSRNIVAKGKYPVALENTGPVPDGRVQVSTSHVQAPVQQKPTVRLPSRIPAPRTVAHSCTCYKQILRPRVHDQYITVPTVQRYIETLHKPVVENIQYEAVPVNSGSTYGSLVGSQLTSSAVPVVSSVAQALPVSAAVESYPVSSGCDVSGVQALPVSSLPVRSFSTGCSECGSQGFY